MTEKTLIGQIEDDVVLCFKSIKIKGTAAILYGDCLREPDASGSLFSTAFSETGKDMAKELFKVDMCKKIMKLNGCITLSLERKDYVVEEHGMNLEVNEKEIILYRYPDTKIIYNKNAWDKITFRYERPLEE